MYEAGERSRASGRGKGVQGGQCPGESYFQKRSCPLLIPTIPLILTDHLACDYITGCIRQVRGIKLYGKTNGICVRLGDHAASSRPGR